jgi:energy-coupling factor transporter ATP-binding protein EcfA2
MSGIELSTAVAAVELIGLAHKQGWFDTLLTALKTKHKVLVLGASGAGKTNFIDSLTEAVPNAIDIMNRTEFVTKNRIIIDKNPFIFIDTPGQIPHKTRRITAIRELMKEDIAGVINVVSYGYHEGRTGKQNAFENGVVSETFLEHQRQVEIEQLNEWTPLLGDRETTGWLITVISKADLWWNRREIVREHYESGSYYEALGSAKDLHPVVLEYCSVFRKFYNEGAMSGEFQDDDRVMAKAHFLKELLASVGKVRNG